MIPIPFWGSLIGGVVGGIAMAAYSKFVIPETMISLLKVIDDISGKV